jgi:glucans biosynthesis protein C
VPKLAAPMDFESPAMQRRHDLDWVRVCAFAILVLYHVGMYYVSWDWHVKSPFASPTAEPFMLLSSPWRLSLLFLVSGAATAFMLGKQEPRFLGRRSWRLLVPLAFGMLVIVPPQSYYEVVEKLPGGYFDGYLAFWGRYLHADPTFCRGADCLHMPTWNHLWFVAYLWVYTLALWLLIKFAPPLIRRIGSISAVACSGFGVLLWPAVLLAMARLTLFPSFGETHALFGDWYNHAQYFAVFVLGFVIARAESIWKSMRAWRWPALGIALLGWVLLVVYFAKYADVDPPVVLLALQRVGWGIVQWSAIVAVLGFAVHWSPSDSPALRYLTAAVFPIYILHQTIIVVLAHNLKPFGLKPVIEAPLLIAATFALCFAGYELIRRVEFLRPLFGLKPRRRECLAATVQADMT